MSKRITMKKSLYRRVLSILVRRELRKITDADDYTLDDLINYHDFMAIECMDNPRILGVSVKSAMYLDALKNYEEANNYSQIERRNK